LREGDATAPPERLLQAIWFHQRLRREQLRGADGHALRVLHPGFWNREAGPDFRGAVVQFDGEAARSGDVEIDVATAGWHGHGHDRNPAFANVILHVVWERAAGPATQPTLELRGVLDSPLAELNDWLGGEHSADLPADLRGRCSAPLRDLAEPAFSELLLQAARVRLQAKAATFTARARESGWEQALWEGLFAALGYKHNVWPFRRLAELLPTFRRSDSPLTWQARLFALGGLLPVELPHRASGSDDYVKRLWDLWWRERDEWRELVLPRSLWRFHGLRPANQPQRRLALAAYWRAAGDLPARLERWLNADEPTKKRPAALLKLLQVERDEFWSWHATLNSPRVSKPQALLGAPRASDLAINVLLPWFWARAAAGRSAAMQRRVEEVYFAWPASEDNAVLKLARQRLLGARPAQKLATAAAQQGLLQIVRDFCERSNALCEQCQFPDLVRQFRSE
jgi:hypothetical protein